MAKLLDKAAKNNVKVHLPVDFVTADKFDENAQVSVQNYSFSMTFLLNESCMYMQHTFFMS